eukprot:COSAG01_NODE_3402_length_6135_cov_21.923956_5_plen_95_part_00
MGRSARTALPTRLLYPLLRENCRGGKRDWRNVFQQIKSWGKGHYREGFLRYIRPRVASRKAARAESLPSMDDCCFLGRVRSPPPAARERLRREG